MKHFRDRNLIIKELLRNVRPQYWDSVKTTLLHCTSREDCENSVAQLRRNTPWFYPEQQ